MDKQEKKIAVWICQGCDIGKSLDVEALEKVADDECEADVVPDPPVPVRRRGRRS